MRHRVNTGISREIKKQCEDKGKLDALQARYRMIIALRDPLDAALLLKRFPGDVPLVAELLADRNENVQLYSAKVLKIAGRIGVKTEPAAPFMHSALKRLNGENEELKKEITEAIKATNPN